MVNKLNPEDNPGFTLEEQDEQLKLAADAVAQSLLDILDTELPGHPGATLNIMDFWLRETREDLMANKSDVFHYLRAAGIVKGDADVVMFKDTVDSLLRSISGLVKAIKGWQREIRAVEKACARKQKVKK